MSSHEESEQVTGPLQLMVKQMDLPDKKFLEQVPDSMICDTLIFDVKQHLGARMMERATQFLIADKWAEKHYPAGHVRDRTKKLLLSSPLDYLISEEASKLDWFFENIPAEQNDNDAWIKLKNLDTTYRCEERLKSKFSRAYSQIGKKEVKKEVMTMHFATVAEPYYSAGAQNWLSGRRRMLWYNKYVAEYFESEKQPSGIGNKDYYFEYYLTKACNDVSDDNAKYRRKIVFAKIRLVLRDQLMSKSETLHSYVKNTLPLPGMLQRLLEPAARVGEYTGKFDATSTNSANVILEPLSRGVVQFLVSDMLRVVYGIELKHKKFEYVNSLIAQPDDLKSIAFVRGTAPPTLNFPGSIGILREWGSNMTVSAGRNTEFYDTQVQAAVDFLLEHPEVTDIIGHSRGAAIAYNAALIVNHMREEKVKMVGLDGAMTLAIAYEKKGYKPATRDGTRATQLIPTSIWQRNINMTSALDSTLDPMGPQERVDAPLTPTAAVSPKTLKGFMKDLLMKLADLFEHSDLTQVATTLAPRLETFQLGHDAGGEGTRYTKKLQAYIDTKFEGHYVATGFEWGYTEEGKRQAVKRETEEGFKLSVRDGEWPLS